MDLQIRNVSDSSDHVVKIADRLGCLGCGVSTVRKNPRRRKVVKIPVKIQFLRLLGQVGTRLTLYNVCAVPWGVCSTVGGVQYRGGIS